MNNKIKLPNFSIVSNGFEYKDCWESIDIRKSMDNICGEITVKTLNFFEEKLKMFKSNGDWKLKKGNSFYAKINDEKISTGYVDKVSINYSADESDIEFYMRDKTSDVVDSSYYSETKNEFKGEKFGEIIKTLCKPFNITVDIDSSVKDVLNKVAEDDFTVDNGVNVNEVIVQVCVKLGVLVTTNEKGNLYLTHPTLDNYCSDVLNDTNILDCSASSSLVDRFSNYITKAEIDSKKLFDVAAEQDWIEHVKKGAYSNNKKVEDAALNNRNRTLILFGDTCNNVDDCTKRSVYEANIRRAKSFAVNYTLEGWTEVKSGKVWKPNMLIKVNDKKIGINEEMLINSVGLTYDDQGFRTNLELVLKECYSLNEQAIILIKKGF
jgi:prophage tail gpP-like protein